MEMSLSEALEDVAFSASGKRQHVYVTRHGGALDAKDLHMQHGDPQLSPTGEVAAAELAESLANAEPRPLHIVSSPFLRCVQTADAVAARLGLPILLEPGICGVLQYFPPELHLLDDLISYFPRIDASYTPVVAQLALEPDRSDGQAARRAASTAITVRDRLSGPILFVGHSSSCLGMVEAFGGSGHVGCCTISHFSCAAQGSSGSWQLEGVEGDASHLSSQYEAPSSMW